MNKNSSHQKSPDAIADEVRNHLKQKGLASCPETKQHIVNFLQNEKKLTRVEVNHRDWTSTEARFYLQFSFDDTIVENAIINRQVAKQLVTA